MKHRHVLFFRISASLLLIAYLSISISLTAAAQNPTELLLGIFFNSENDMTDSIYVSFDGYTFRKIGAAYEDRAPDSREDYQIIRDDTNGEVNCLHDPGLMYKDGVFWSLSGFTMNKPGSNPISNMFIPMWGYSKDLVHWSYPASGSSTNVSVSSSYLPYSKSGKKDNPLFDSVAPDVFLDANNDIWIVVSMGYFGSWHNDVPQADKMSPYLVKVTDLRVNSNCGNLETVSQKGLAPIAGYADAIPVNLPKLPDGPQKAEGEDNRIDGSFYREGNTYYLVIKRHGAINEIWSINNLKDVSNASKWTLINSDFLKGYEGPCLTKYKGNYYIYTDKLADYPYDNHDGKTGIYVTSSSSLRGVWKEKTKVKLIADNTGRLCEGRHGSVITVTDPHAVSIIMDLYYKCGYTYDHNSDKPSSVDMNGWFYSNGHYYWYENGYPLKSREFYDASTDAWYWFDEDGTMAAEKDVFIPYNPPDRTKGKWVYYNSDGHMVKGEHFHNKHWYYYDKITGERASGFVNLPEYGDPDGKWVYYNASGHMVYGEQCINNNWYWFDMVTGKMAHGWTTLPDGRKCHYDEVTGILIETA